jgi:MFS family permease
MFIAATISFAIATGIFFLMVRHAPTRDRQPQRADFNSLRSSLTRMFALMISGGLITWILIIDGVRDVAFKLSFDLMPIYLTEIGQISKSQIGLMDGLFGIALALTTLPAGWLVDKTSERVGISIGLVIMVLSRLVFAIAGAFWGFAGSWILLGIGGGLLDPAGSALIAKGVPREVRGLTYGLVATSLGILSLPAPWIGSQIWKYLGPQAPFLLTVGLGCMAIIPAWFKLVLPAKARQEPEMAFTHLLFMKGNTAGGTYARRAQERYFRGETFSRQPFERE